MVVGAGSSGLIAAALLAKKYDRVRIFEGDKEIGGVTKDVLSDDGREYYAGCHYLIPSYLPSGYDYSSLTTFEHRYGSLTLVQGKWIFKDDFAGPCFPDSWIEFTHSKAKLEPDWQTYSLLDRISLYPREVEQYLLDFMRKYLPISALDSIPGEGASVFGISRISGNSNDQELVAMKNRSPLYDELIGASRTLLGMNFETAAVPQDGYSRFWKGLLAQVGTSADVELIRRAKINRPGALAEVDALAPGVKLWTADPRYPVRHFSHSRLESLSYKKYFTGIFLDSFSGPRTPHYLNVFSQHGKLTRAYFYELGGEVRVTFESVQSFSNLKELLAEVLPALQASHISIGVPNQEIRSLESRQYFPMTTNDETLIRLTTERMKDDGWLDSGMSLSNRKNRVQKITHSIDSHFALQGPHG